MVEEPGATGPPQVSKAFQMHAPYGLENAPYGPENAPYGLENAPYGREIQTTVPFQNERFSFGFWFLMLCCM